MEEKIHFLDEETRCGHHISAKTKKIWACQMDILERFKEVCEEHGLRYWLDSGTLLGAIRHQGYIPWDDDIDVIMLREDYDRLVSIVQDEFRHPYVFQTAYSERNFVRGHAQIRNINTTGIIPSEINKSFNQGIFIDVFVLDYIPNDEEEYLRQEKAAGNKRYRLEMLATPLKDFRVNLSRIFKALKFKLKYPDKKAFNNLYASYEDVFRQNKEQECTHLATSAWKYRSFKRDKRFYEGTVTKKFEYLELPVPSGYDELLRTLYGEYMTPVQAPNQHGEVIFDTDTPADITIKKLRKNR